MKYYNEPSKKLPIIECDVVVAGAGTSGVFAAIAAARNGAKTMVIESKGYPGGIAVEGGTALHSFFNLYKPFEDVEKRQLIKGIPQEFIDRLIKAGGCSGHVEMEAGYDYDSINTSIDTEIYKLVAFEMMVEAGVKCMMNSLVVDAIVKDRTIKGVIIENRGGRQVIMAKSFIDATGHGDLSAYAGASFSEPCDYPSAHAIGVGGVSIEKYYDYIVSHNALKEIAYGIRDGKENKIVRLSPGENGKFVNDVNKPANMPAGLIDEIKEIGMALVTTSVHDDYFMFIKLNYHIGGPSTDMDKVNKAELELRRRQVKAIKILRKYIPGCENAFITRTAPSFAIRRGRTIECDYDISQEEVIEGKHFDDDIYSYGFHDYAPRIQIKNGRSYGIPYRAICVKNINNLYSIGMMITSDHDAHMSTRNTVSCMAMGQSSGTASALCTKLSLTTRQLPYETLRATLINDNVYLEN